MNNIKDIVYKTSVDEINMLNNLSVQELEKHPYLLKVSQLKNNHILAIIKQEEIDYKQEDLSLRTTMYNLREERNEVMKKHIELQEQKLK